MSFRPFKVKAGKSQIVRLSFSFVSFRVLRQEKLLSYL